MKKMREEWGKENEGKSKIWKIWGRNEGDGEKNVNEI